MARLKSLHYKLIDAWGDLIADSILERHNDEIKLLWLFRNGHTKEVVLTGKENQLIDGLLECDILSWDGKTFDLPVEDGDSWYLDIVFDDKHVHCNGGGYPKDFFRFATLIGLNNRKDKSKEEYYNLMSENVTVYDLWPEECRYESYCDKDVEDILYYEYDRLKEFRKDVKDTM